jgi:hypothetical protein
LTRLLGAESSSEFQARLERYHPGRVVAAEPHAQQSGNNRMIDTILTETMEALTRYHWPGNIRELQNVVERSVIISKGATLTVVLNELKPDEGLKTNQSCEALQQILSETERTQILRALERSNWVIAGPNGAAARLGIKRTTLQSRMQKLSIGLRRTPFPQDPVLPSAASNPDGRILKWPILNAPHRGRERKQWHSAHA